MIDYLFFFCYSHTDGFRVHVALFLKEKICLTNNANKQETLQTIECSINIGPFVNGCQNKNEVTERDETQSLFSVKEDI